MIPVMKPKLPSAAQLLPYLRRIDEARIYSNFGPLVGALEERLAAQWGLQANTVATVANATQGLALALMAQQPKPGTLCIMPAWTFIASAHAAVLAGLTPYFVDVDSETWAIDVATVSAAIAGAPGEVGAVMPVVPFGRPLDFAAWNRFQAETGLAVVIDAAAGFDTLEPGAVPAVVSLHATKVLGIGEGGVVTSTQPALIDEIRARSNFGFVDSRDAVMMATNAKLSEYHAAVAHAALDEWPDVRAEWFEAAAAYRSALAGLNQIRLQPGFGESWIASTCVVSLGDDVVHGERLLLSRQIGSRQWWGKGAHRHPATQDFSHTDVAVTENLARTTIGVPFFRGLDVAAAARVCDTLREATTLS
jgi:dTDP-4-amino-4,6-dideoxygalactose transaminase